MNSNFVQANWNITNDTKTLGGGGLRETTFVPTSGGITGFEDDYDQFDVEDNHYNNKGGNNK
jgi:hypothetical protein